MEYDYKGLKAITKQKDWIAPTKLSETPPLDIIGNVNLRKRIAQLTGSGYSALWKGMFPNAWVRLLTEAGIDERTIKKQSVALRSAMMQGQRNIWKIRNDIKHNKPVQKEEANRIDKAFRVLALLKLNSFDDTPHSVRQKTAPKRREWLKRQYQRAGRALLQSQEEDRKTQIRIKHAQQIRTNNLETNRMLKTNTSQLSIEESWGLTNKRKRRTSTSTAQSTSDKKETPGTTYPKTQSTQTKPSQNKEPNTYKNTLTKKETRHRKAASMEEKKHRYQQKFERRYLAKIKKYLGTDTKVKESRRDKKRRKKVYQNVETEEKERRTTPQMNLTAEDKDEETPPVHRTKRQRNSGQQELDEEEQSETEPTQKVRTVSLRQRRRIEEDEETQVDSVDQVQLTAMMEQRLLEEVGPSEPDKRTTVEMEEQSRGHIPPEPD